MNDISFSLNETIWTNSGVIATPVDIDRLQLEPLGHIPPKLPLSETYKVRLQSHSELTLVTGGNGQFCIGALSKNRWIAGKYILDRNGYIQDYPIQYEWDSTEGIWLRFDEVIRDLKIGIVTNEKRLSSPLPSIRHNVYLYSRGILSYVMFNPGFLISMPQPLLLNLLNKNPLGLYIECDKTTKNTFLVRYPTNTDLPTTNLPIRYRLSIPELETTIVFLLQSPMVTIEHQLDKFDDEHLDRYTLRLKLIGERPVKARIRKKGGKTHIKQDLLLSNTSPINTIELSCGRDSDIFSYNVTVETDETIITNRKRIIQFPKRQRLNIFPPLINWNTDNQIVSILVKSINDVRGDGMDLLFYFPPELENTEVEMDDSDPIRTTLYLPCRPSQDLWTDIITIHNRRDHSIAYLPVLKTHSCQLDTVQC